VQKFLFVILSFTYFSLPTWALDPVKADYVCGRLNSGFDETCNSLIRGKKFDGLAAAACDRYNDQQETLDCMRIIVNKSFQASAVETCDNFYQGGDSNLCFQAIANRKYSEKQVARCNAMESTEGTIACFSKVDTVLTSPVDGVINAWTDTTQKSCGQYRTRIFVSVQPPENCQNSRIIFLGNKNFGSTETTVIRGQRYRLIPDVLTLKNNQIIPDYVYERFSTELISASLVRRYHNQNEGSNVRGLFDYRSHTMIQMRLPEAVIDSVVQFGFINQHQIKYTHGAYDPVRRDQVESSLLKIQFEREYTYGYENPANFIRPKYGFLTYDKDSDGEQRGKFEKSYGNIVVTFKNEIKDRTTFTGVDALNGNYDANGNVSIGLVKAYSFDVHSAQQLHKIADPSGSSEDFWEAQIWGNLTLQDVDYFMVNCPGDAQISQKAYDTLIATGKPIYQCGFLDDHSHFEKLEQYQAGDPKLQSKPAALVGTAMKAMLVY
jgi:hypothetical protein